MFTAAKCWPWPFQPCEPEARVKPRANSVKSPEILGFNGSSLGAVRCREQRGGVVLHNK